MKIGPLFMLLRPAQWIKNLFVLIPLVFSFQLVHPSKVIDSLIATALFCLYASGIYIINDLRDVKADRRHPTKKLRPLASGKVTRSQALTLLTLLLAPIAGFAVSAHFNWAFWAFLTIYAVMSLSYTFGLKQVALLEMFIVASGYVLRVLAGCAAIDDSASPWILAATGTLALLIVAGKRRAEMAGNIEAEQSRRSLKGYNIAFLDSIITMLAATAIVTYLLFTTSDYASARFHSPHFVGTSIFVLYGVMRYLQLIKVHQGAEDPTYLALTDKSLRFAMLGWLLTCAGLIYL